MECSKEEAIRAKEIALKKMENQDFSGAHKAAIISQRLYPGLENINQIICVCDVHCSAENKKLGNERDWYDILKVEQSADEMLIKKQYRKLALLLHPDKNKFSGAESAFMLIGEAQEVLLDKDKRIVYDARYRRFFQNTAPNPPPEEDKNAKPPSGKKNMSTTVSSDVKKKAQQQAEPVDPSRLETFWTVCPFCSVRYQYSITALNWNLKCQSCKKAFIAYDMCTKSTPPGSKVNQTDTSAQTGALNQGVSSKGGGTSNVKFAKSGMSPPAGKSNKTNELNTGAKSRASSGGSNHAEAKDVKKVTKRENHESAEIAGAKRLKKEVKDSPAKSSARRRDMASIKVLFSRHLNEDIIRQLKKILARLGVTAVSLVSDATHFVAGEFLRTTNMLEAIAHSKPVVHYLWLERCGQAGCYVDEQKYLLRDVKKEEELGFSMPDSLARASQHPLLEGKRVLITPNTMPEVEILSNLVKAVGGQAFERICRSIYKGDKLHKNLIVLSCEEDYEFCLPLLKKGAEVYSSELLLNGIVTQKLEFERHRLFMDQVKKMRSTIWLKKGGKSSSR